MTDTWIRETPILPRLPNPQIWLKSELLDINNESRFSSDFRDYEGASWTLRKSEPLRGYEPTFDSSFDWHVKNAWFFPWQFSQARLEPCYGRSRANFVIRHIGHWSGEAERWDALLSTLNRPLRGAAGLSVRRTVALTPFCIIIQYYAGEAASPVGFEIVHTEILFFYTFESFIQEVLVRNAHVGGTDVGTITKAYAHVYTNTRPNAALLRDPGELELASLTTAGFDWSGIRDHMLPPPIGGNLEDWPYRLRETLFFCRLQTHLMVAIAAACRGIAAFQETQDSDLVLPLASSPVVDQLAPFWLSHLLGGYDHADACMSLLGCLVDPRGKNVKLGPHGRIIPEGTGMRTEVEESVGMCNSPFGYDDMAETRDTFRLGIFETAIDDEALMAWDQGVRNRLIERRER